MPGDGAAPVEGAGPVERDGGGGIELLLLPVAPLPLKGVAVPSLIMPLSSKPGGGVAPERVLPVLIIMPLSPEGAERTPSMFPGVGLSVTGFQPSLALLVLRLGGVSRELRRPPLARPAGIPGAPEPGAFVRIGREDEGAP